MNHPVDVDLRMPYVNRIKGVWMVNRTEVRASWKAYIEIVTRMPPPPPLSQRSVAHELSSLGELCERLKEILKQSGPCVGRNDDDALSFASLTLTVINTALRPVLAQPEHVSRPPENHQRPDEKAALEQLDRVYPVLVDFGNLLERAAGVAL